eukprot:g1002.t1
MSSHRRKWRRFQFFEKKTIQDTSHIAQLEATSFCSGGGYIFVSDAHGFVSILDRNFVQVARFKAHEFIVTHLQHICSHDVLITVGDGIDPRTEKEKRETVDAASQAAHYATLHNLPLIDVKKQKEILPCSTAKFWSIVDNGAPKLLYEIKVFMQFAQQPITCMSAKEDLSAIAFGLLGGDIILFRGDLFRNRNLRQSVLRSSAPKESKSEPITGLSFCSWFDDEGNKGRKNVSLFCVTEKRVESRLIPDIGVENFPVTSLDARGAIPGCSVLSSIGGLSRTSSERHLVVAQTDGAIYFYTPDFMGQCYIFDHEKSSLYWARDYLIVESIVPGGLHDLREVSLYDLRNRFRAFHFTLRYPKRVKYVFSTEGSKIIIVTSMHEIIELTEAEMTTKMSHLFTLNLFTIAIALAKDADYSHDRIIDIYRRYGDHLYEHGDYDSAIVQYTSTIGIVEPSYVIRRFLSASRMHNLAYYLESLHLTSGRKGDSVTPEQTQLLLDCYCKLGATGKIHAFARGLIGEVYEEDEEKKLYRVMEPAAVREARLERFRKRQERKKKREEKAIEEENARTAASYKHLKERERLKREDDDNDEKKSDGDVEDELNDDEKVCFDVPTAVEYLRSSKFPDDALLLAYNHAQHAWVMRLLVLDRHAYAAALQYVWRLPFSLAKKFMEKYGKELVSHCPRGSNRLICELCIGYQPKEFFVKKKLEFLDVAYNDDDDAYACENFTEEKNVEIANPDEFMHCYVTLERKENEDLLCDFLLCVTRWNSNCSTLIWNTFLEILLKKNDKEKVIELLENPGAQYDDWHALVLVQTLKFRPGEIILYKKLHMYHMIASYWMQSSDHEQSIAFCLKFGEKDPELWTKLLTHLTEIQPTTKSQIEAIEMVLSKVNMEPIIALEILSRNPDLPLSVFLPYLTDRLSMWQKIEEEEAKEIEKLREDSTKMRKEIQELSNSAKLFNNSKCIACSLPIDLPAIHFYSGHSYHARCLASQEVMICPALLKETRVVHNIIEGLKVNKEEGGLKEKFFHELGERENDGFTTVSKYFGKGLFSKLESFQEYEDQ